MIKRIDTKNRQEAQKILQVQFPSYKMEAELIGFDGIPTLKETDEDILKSEEVYMGYYDKDELAGILAYSKEDNEITITKLAIHPNHFRKGFGSKLLTHLFESYPESIVFKVSTGSKNDPAVRLYMNHGFQIVGQTEVSASIYLTHFEKLAVNGTNK